jgi:hypothetical protein
MGMPSPLPLEGLLAKMGPLGQILTGEKTTGVGMENWRKKNGADDSALMLPPPVPAPIHIVAAGV